MIEDPLDDGGVLGRSGAEVPGRGVDGGVAEEGLDLGGVGSALAEARAEGVAAAVGARAWDVGAGAGGEDDLGDAGDGERAALPGPGGSGQPPAGAEGPELQVWLGQRPAAFGARAGPQTAVGQPRVAGDLTPFQRDLAWSGARGAGLQREAVDRAGELGRLLSPGGSVAARNRPACWCRIALSR